MRCYSKINHQLNESDVTLKDRMNFGATLRLTHPRVQKLLCKYVTGSEATQMYLKLIFYSLHSMLSAKFTVFQRVYYLWYCIFYYRMWRNWLKSQKQYSTTSNFITVNSSTGLELNAHGILNLVLKCIKINNFETFFPSSQSCEAEFRNLRMLSSTFAMQVNCTVLEFQHKLNKLEMMSKIFAHNFDGKTINFPRTRFLNASYEKQTESFEEFSK